MSEDFPGLKPIPRAALRAIKEKKIKELRDRKPPRPLEDFEEGTPMLGFGKKKIKRQQAKG